MGTTLNTAITVIIINTYSIQHSPNHALQPASHLLYSLNGEFKSNIIAPTVKQPPKYLLYPLNGGLKSNITSETVKQPPNNLFCSVNGGLNHIFYLVNDGFKAHITSPTVKQPLNHTFTSTIKSTSLESVPFKSESVAFKLVTTKSYLSQPTPTFKPQTYDTFNGYPAYIKSYLSYPPPTYTFHALKAGYPADITFTFSVSVSFTFSIWDGLKEVKILLKAKDIIIIIIFALFLYSDIAYLTNEREKEYFNEKKRKERKGKEKENRISAILNCISSIFQQYLSQLRSQPIS